MPISRRAFVTSAVASGIALSLKRLAIADKSRFAARDSAGARRLEPGCRRRGRIDGVAKVTGAKLYASDFAPRICPDGRQRPRTPCCSGPRTRRMSMPALTCRGSATR